MLKLDYVRIHCWTQINKGVLYTPVSLRNPFHALLLIKSIDTSTPTKSHPSNLVHSLVSLRWRHCNHWWLFMKINFIIFSAATQNHGLLTTNFFALSTDFHLSFLSCTLWSHAWYSTDLAKMRFMYSLRIYLIFQVWIAVEYL